MTINQPLIFGEVLMDHFPDGHRVLGGAPFNVAWNLQGLGLNPMFVSAVGADEEGQEVREKMNAWGMDGSGLQVAKQWPTGKVLVEIQSGQPQFRVLDQQAYDEINFPSFDVSPHRFSLLYFGSLAFRRETSRTTILQLIKETTLPRFVDINIRQPWFELESASDLLHKADWVKLNKDELAFLSDSNCETPAQIVQGVGELQHRHGAKQFFITCGSAGAFAIDAKGDWLFVESPKPEPLIDAVGAGDAFSAAVIAGIDRGLGLQEILETAVGFASAACEIQGATSTNPTHYALHTIDQ